jgi:hypothetical protein
VTPSQFKDVLVFLRKVNRGILPTQPFSVEKSVSRFREGSDSGDDSPGICDLRLSTLL